MAEGKKSFLLYTDLIHTVSKLPDNKAGKLFKTILEYVNDLNPKVDELEILLQVAFEPVKNQLKRNLKNWEAERSKRSEAGKKGGIKSGESRRSEAKRRSASKNEANEADNVSVSVNVNGSVSERENTGTPADLSNSNLYRKPNIPTKNELWEMFSNQGGTIEMAKSFWEKHEGTGWYLNNSPIVNVSPLVGKFITNWNKNEKKDAPAQSGSAPLKTLHDD